MVRFRVRLQGHDLKGPSHMHSNNRGLKQVPVARLLELTLPIEDGALRDNCILPRHGVFEDPVAPVFPSLSKLEDAQTLSVGASLEKSLNGYAPLQGLLSRAAILSVAGERLFPVDGALPDAFLGGGAKFGLWGQRNSKKPCVNSATKLPGRRVLAPVLLQGGSFGNGAQEPTCLSQSRPRRCRSDVPRLPL